MKVWEVQNSFGIENLVMSEREKPSPKDGEVLVKMNAVSLNYRDLLMVRGHYNPKQPLPLIPCSDGAGVVEAVGAEVKSLEVGDHVTSLFSQTWLAGQPKISDVRHTLGGPLDGTLAEYMIFKESGVIAIPNAMSFIEAATLPCAALTAWTALVEEAKVRPGDTILIQGTGGVALFALQFAKILGAKVIITSSSDEKLQQAKEMGADYTINYKDNPKWGAKAREITNKQGVDFIIELGGAGTLEQSFQAARPGATIALIGVLSGVSKDLNIIPIIMQKLNVMGIFVGSQQNFANMNRAIEQHKIKPVIHKTFPFAQAQDAFHHIASGSHFGKICIDFETA